MESAMKGFNGFNGFNGFDGVSVVNYLSGAVMHLDTSLEDGTINELTDRTGNFLTTMPAYNITTSVFTSDPGWLDGSLAGSQNWRTLAENCAAVQFDDQPFTVGVWLKKSSSSIGDVVGKNSSDGSGAGWKVDVTSGAIRLTIEDDSGSAITISVTGLDDTSESPFFFWFTRNADNTWTLKEETSGTSTTSATLNYNLKDNGYFGVGLADNTTFTGKIGDVVIWPETKDAEFMEGYFNANKSDFGL